MRKKSESFLPGFMVLHGNRLEDLRELLINVIKNYRLPVLSPEIILVQNNGMKHWVERSLASDTAFGICAATRIELPSSYLWSIYRTVLSDVQIPVHMPFDKKNLTWRLYKLLPELIKQDSFDPLQSYLGDSPDGRRLFQLASQIADVFDGYQNYRADWLMDWARGKDDLVSDSYLRNPQKPYKLSAEEVWQSTLWRALREDIGEALADASRASVHEQFMKRMDVLIKEFQKTKIRPAGLPERVVIFGISSLPPQVIEAFAKLGNMCQVFMFVQNPCQYYWGNIVDGHEMLRTLSRSRQRAMPVEHHMSTQPLLASWGKQGRDYFHLLDDFDNVEAYRGALESVLQKVEVFHDPVAENDTSPNQLAYVQSSILNLTSFDQEKNKFKSKVNDDHSIQFVSAHSAQREVEILHDQMHAWFDRDEELEPEDIMVMVPDMEAFLPHIRAVFGRFKLGDDRYIPFSIADTTPKETPIVRALTQLLSTPTLKLSWVDWMDLFEVDAVRKKFNLISDEVDQLKEWIIGSGVRWGLDEAHRVQRGMDDEINGLGQNTWAFGVRRILLGYALEKDKSCGDTLSYPGINGLDAALIGKLLSWIDAVELINKVLSHEHSASKWVEIFRDLISSFFEKCDDAQERLLVKVLDPLEQWEKICSDCELVDPLPLNVVRDYWLSQLEEVGLQQRFFGGGVQFGTLMPMRSIPFKHICLLGMNDGDFPRQTSARDFDLMSQHWRTGDRSRREDDRYLFLEALLCARQKLYISWQGHSVRDNSEQPPSVLVAQLIDYLSAVWTTTVEPEQYPLQPFSKKYFEEGSKFCTYDKDWDISENSGNQESANKYKPSKDISQTVNQQNAQNARVFERINLEELHRLLRNPVEIFFRSRLNIYFDKLDKETVAAEPFELNKLEKFNIARDLLESDSFETGLHNLALSGQLPMSSYGVNIGEELSTSVQEIINQRSELQSNYPDICAPITISLNLGSTVLEGVLSEVRSKVNPKNNEIEYLQVDQRVGAITEKKRIRGHVITKLWVNHLVACASGYKLTSIQIGSDALIVLNALDAEEAKKILTQLMRVYKEAWQRPLPVACKTGLAWLQSELVNRLAQAKGGGAAVEDPDEVAQEIFDPSSPSKYGPKGDRKDSLYLMRAFEDYEDIKEELPRYSQELYGAMIKNAQITSLGEVIA